MLYQLIHTLVIHLRTHWLEEDADAYVYDPQVMCIQSASSYSYSNATTTTTTATLGSACTFWNETALQFAVGVKGFEGEEYCFGFQGQEKSPEIHDNHYTAKFWEYDSRIGRRWNIDPVVKVHESPYASLANNPIWFVDPNGADSLNVHQWNNSDGMVQTNESMVTDGKAGLSYNITDEISGQSYSGFFPDINVTASRINKTGETAESSFSLSKSSNKLEASLQGDNYPNTGGSYSPIVNAGIEVKANYTYGHVEQAFKLRYEEKRGGSETVSALTETYANTTKNSVGLEGYFYMKFEQNVFSFDNTQAPMKFKIGPVQLNIDPATSVIKLGVSANPSNKMELKQKVSKVTLYKQNVNLGGGQ